MEKKDGIVSLSARDRRTLKSRAYELSKVEEHLIDNNADSIFVVKFLLSDEVYGIETSFIKEVLPLKDLTVVPCTPDFILGVINIRGQIFTVINPKKILMLPEKGISEFTKVMILSYENISFGIVADAILGNQYIANSEIGSLPYVKSDIKRDYLVGATAKGVIILNAKAFMSSSELVVNQENKKR
ncbi:MAG: chemotaxis protein CheW [Bacteroidetes bacterium]|nr:chemotaxis protein CheW [Bacteroidota bacterium]